MFFCPECTEAIPDNSFVCPKCNAQLNINHENEQATVYASQKPDETPQNSKQVKKPLKWIGAIIAVAITAVAAFWGFNEVQKSNLKNELLRDWLYADESLIKVLDFSDSEIDYRVETGYSWLDSTIATYSYKVVSGNKIEIKRYTDKYQEFEITFNDDKSMLTVKPAITSVDSVEYWFNFD